jgi:hypothetical protein
VTIVSAYALPASVAWTALALCLNALPLMPAALIGAGIYGACYGTSETAERPGPRPPGTSWQVPQSLVKGKSRPRRIIAWGVILGPGFATRNPYAGFGMLAILAAVTGNPPTGAALGALIGIAHGSGRAVGVLRDSRTAADADYSRSVLRSIYWRRTDGLLLLATAVTATIDTVYHFL